MGSLGGRSDASKLGICGRILEVADRSMRGSGPARGGAKGLSMRLRVLEPPMVMGGTGETSASIISDESAAAASASRAARETLLACR
jgi:hypothetical protein